MSVGVDFSSGTYGQDIYTEDLYVPFSFTYERGPWLARITTAFVGTRGPGNPQEGTNDPLRETDTGIGDIYLDASYYWTPVTPWLPYFDFGVRLKIPTASREDFLGTGEVDTTLGLDLSYWLGDFTPFVRVAYRFLGGNEEFQLNDGFKMSIGLQYRLTPKFSLGITHYWRQSTNNTQADPQEISPYASYRATDHITLTPYVVFGLTASTLDTAGGLTVSYRF